MDEEIETTIPAENAMEAKSVPMTPSSSRSSAEDDSDAKSDIETVATTDDEGDVNRGVTTDVLLKPEPATEKTQSLEKDSTEASEPASSESTKGISTAEAEKHYISLNQYLLPKIRLLKILLQTDFLAGCIIIGNTIILGGLNSLKSSTATQLTAAILELIINQTFDANGVMRLLVMHLFYEFFTQMISGINCYARRRARRPMQKRLGTDLMLAFGSLPFEMMLNKETSRDFAEVYLPICR